MRTRRVVPRLILLTIVLVTPAFRMFAQESLPDKAEAGTEPPQNERIVEGRPALYSLKRAIHPLTWLEVAPKPLFRSAESGFINRLIMRKPDDSKTSGVRFGVDGAGTASGFGPKVTFFNKDFLGRGIDIEIPLVYTLSRYELYRFKASVPLASDKVVDRLSLDLGTSYSSRARDDFFGIGNDVPRESEAQFRMVSREASAGLTAKLSEAWTSGLHAVYRRVGVTEPTFGHNAQDRFDDSSVPGLSGGAALRSLVFSLGRDSELQENNSFRGGSDQFEVSFNESAGGHEFGYWQYHFDSRHFFPISRDGRKVIAARALVETNQARDGRLVPFFDMPWVGASSTVRGFENFRFRDKSAVAATLEYRYRIWPAMDWGVFIDEGQVGPQLGDLALNRFHTGYGVRLFVWPKPDFPISVDYGRSRETWRVYLNINAKF